MKVYPPCFLRKQSRGAAKIAWKLSLNAIFLKYAILLFVFLNLFYSAVYSIDDRQGLGVQPQQPQQPPQQPQQFQQPKAQGPEPYQNQRPPVSMLPPVAAGIPPVPSPQITTPPVMPAAITRPQPNINYQPVTIHANSQSSPAMAILPTANAPAELPQTPIIGNSIGKVVNTGSEKDGLPWIEVKDEVFNETLKIKINPKSTPMLKKSTPVGYRDIKIGDVVNVIFNQQGEDIVANFVSILTEEDLKAMEEDLKKDSNLETGNKPKVDHIPAAK